MVYQQCGPSCPQTCDTNEDTDCSGGCVEGCFCPSGQVLYNGNCIDMNDCAGKYEKTQSHCKETTMQPSSNKLCQKLIINYKAYTYM